jgi:hypothetical protein
MPTAAKLPLVHATSRGWSTSVSNGGGERPTASGKRIFEKSDFHQGTFRIPGNFPQEVSPQLLIGAGIRVHSFFLN